MDEYKQALVIRGDLDMSPGKAVAQGAHVSVRAVQTADDDAVDEWTPAMPKITLEATDKEHLTVLQTKAERAGLPVVRVVDQGRTELERDTLTAIAIGPAPESAVDKITGNLSLY